MKPIFLSTSFNITYNLTVEEFLFNNLHKFHSPLLYIYTGSDCVVIGKHQNPFKEVNLKYLKDNNITLCRRTSGGGAVYQDLGNFCFGFLGNYKNLNDKETFKIRNSEVITKSLINIGLKSNKVLFNGRNDIMYNNKKISGSAFRIDIQNRRYIHHGTMLVNVDLDRMKKVLHPHKLKMMANGVSSVRSRVDNIKKYLPSITNETVYQSIMRQFMKSYYPNIHFNNLNDVVTRLKNEKNQTNKDIMNKFKYYSSYQWIYGSTPAFTNSLIYKFPFGLIEIVFDVQSGFIHNAFIYSDSNDSLFIDKIKKGLNTFDYKRKYTYTKEGLSSFLSSLNERYIDDHRMKEIERVFINKLI